MCREGYQKLAMYMNLITSRGTPIGHETKVAGNELPCACKHWTTTTTTALCDYVLGCLCAANGADRQYPLIEELEAATPVHGALPLEATPHVWGEAPQISRVDP